MEDKKELTHFNKLFSINCNEKIEKKSNGSVELSYLSWCYAWSETKKMYPDAVYEILKFGENKLPYVFDEKTGYMVFTRVEIEGIDHEMWLPVMDSANKAMKDKPYTYKVKKYNYQTKEYQYVEKTVEPATMFDINKTIMRCLTKNLAMFGLGLYIYAGEDLPENIDDEKTTIQTKEEKPKTTKTTKSAKTEPAKEILIQDSQKEIIKEKFTKEEIKDYLVQVKKAKLSDLNIMEASALIKTKAEAQK